MDENLCPLENHAPFILPDLQDNPSLEDTKDGKLDSEEPFDDEIEMESTVSQSQSETCQDFTLLIEQMWKSHFGNGIICL